MNEERTAAQAKKDMASASYRAGNLDEAKALYAEACRLAPGDVEARLMLGNLNARLGHVDEAEAAYEEAARLDAASAEVREHLGDLLSSEGRDADAVSWYRQALGIDSHAVLAHMKLAKALFRLGKYQDSMAVYRDALAVDPKCRQAVLGMANAYAQLEPDIMLPGEDYLTLLRRIHEELRPRTYVEIGVFKGESLTLVGDGTLALGIDPAPQIAHALQPTTKVFAETSDDFFSRRDPCTELGGQAVDLAFIDGMHQFEFALRDFIHLERYCAPRSTILIHDCYPIDETTAARERGDTYYWSGDIWKLTLCLKKYRPDLAIHTVAAAPTGLGMVRNLNPRSTVLGDNYQRICEEYGSLPYSAIGRCKAHLLNLFPNVWPQVRALLECP